MGRCDLSSVVAKHLYSKTAIIQSSTGGLPAAIRAAKSYDIDDLPQQHMRAFMADVSRSVYGPIRQYPHDVH
jgi:hypothetical protein